MILKAKSKVGLSSSVKFDSPTVAIDWKGTGNCEGKVCLACNANASRYCCPTCFIPYCSAACFQKHNIDCTENFSRNRVKDLLRHQKNDSLRFDDQSCRDDIFCDAPSPSDGMSVLSELSCGSKCADSLTEIEMLQIDEEFKAMGITKREMSSKLSLWTPWWRGGNHHILKIGNSNHQSILGGIVSNVHVPNKVNEVIDALRKNCKTSFSQIGVRPSINILYTVFSVVMSYTIVMRICDGEPMQQKEDFIELLSSLSSVLDRDFQPQSISSVIERWVISARRLPQVRNLSRDMIKSVLDDVHHIILSKSMVVLSLLDCWIVVACSWQFKETTITSLENVSDLIDQYILIFQKPPSRRHSCPNSLDKLTRKMYFLLLFCLDDSCDIQQIATEIVQYSKECMA